MDPETDKLIKMFADNSLTDIQDKFPELIQQYFQKDYKIIEEDFYKQNYDLIKKFKIEIENIAPGVSEKQRVKRCLEIYWKKTNFNLMCEDQFKLQMEVFSKLVLYTFDKKWSAEQKNHFLQISEILRDYNNYFISYTNHYAKTINLNYNKIYENIFTSEDYDTSDVEKKNLLAVALHKYFIKNNLRKGFFDRDMIRLSDIISEQVKKNVEKTIAFVQLISKASFEFTSPNWSHIEYLGYIESRNKFKNGNAYKSGFTPLPFFILIEDDPFPLNEQLIPDEYLDWVKTAKGSLHEDMTAKVDFTNFEKSIRVLINDITVLQNEIIAAVPD